MINIEELSQLFSTASREDTFTNFIINNFEDSYDCWNLKPSCILKDISIPKHNSLGQRNSWTELKLFNNGTIVYAFEEDYLDRGIKENEDYVKAKTLEVVSLNDYKTYTLITVKSGKSWTLGRRGILVNGKILDGDMLEVKGDYFIQTNNLESTYINHRSWERFTLVQDEIRYVMKPIPHLNDKSPWDGVSSKKIQYPKSLRTYGLEEEVLSLFLSIVLMERYTRDFISSRLMEDPKSNEGNESVIGCLYIINVFKYMFVNIDVLRKPVNNKLISIYDETLFLKGRAFWNMILSFKKSDANEDTIFDLEEISNHLSIDEYDSVLKLAGCAIKDSVIVYMILLKYLIIESGSKNNKVIDINITMPTKVLPIFEYSDELDSKINDVIPPIELEQDYDSESTIYKNKVNYYSKCRNFMTELEKDVLENHLESIFLDIINYNDSLLTRIDFSAVMNILRDKNNYNSLVLTRKLAQYYAYIMLGIVVLD